ncbi:MAG: hypothetical protein HY716_05670 [Planctomycetes bacterium]|nr:hypothetical protein [Planctomycetota bacterium]
MKNIAMLPAVAVLWVLPGARAQEKDVPQYAFTQGEVQRYSVDLDVNVSLEGSDPAFISKLSKKPFMLALDAVVENAVLAVREADGTALFERRFATMNAKGQLNDQSFEFQYEREKNEKENLSLPMMEAYFQMWCFDLLKFSVASDGEYAVTEDRQKKDFTRLMTRAGALYWPIPADANTWTTELEFAVPALHDHLWLEILNKKLKVITGKNLLVIEGDIRLKKKVPPQFEQVEKDVPLSERQQPPSMDITYDVKGKSKVEFDLKNRRLHSVHLQIDVTMDGKGDAGVKMASIKGKVQYEEKQVWKD